MMTTRMFTKLLAGLGLFSALSFGQWNSPPYQSAYPSNASQQPIPAGGSLGQPGTVNYVEGQVSLNQQQLSNPATSLPMRAGDVLSTGANGYAEVLLTPGAFLRIGPNSQITPTALGLATTNLRLSLGAADVEVDQLVKGTHLSITLNSGTALLEKEGLYVFNADQNDVKVMDGKATVTVASRSKSIGRGDELLLASAKPLKTHGIDVNAEKAQPLYVWSEARSQTESQANVAVAENVATYGGWYGLGWYWDPYLTSWAFLPGDGFLYSPFGWGFYSPFYIGYYGYPGYWGHGGHWGHYGFGHGYVGGMNSRVSGFRGGFAGGGGFHGGGGGGRR